MLSVEEIARFVRFGGEGPLISTAALKLHTYGVAVSIQCGRPGFVDDAYLNALPVDTVTPALELALAGAWTREGTGYRVSPAETLRIAREIRRQLSELEYRSPSRPQPGR